MENPVTKATLGTRQSTKAGKARNTTQKTKTLSNAATWTPSKIRMNSVAGEMLEWTGGSQVLF